MTMPGPPDTARLADTDLAIRRLAESVDPRLVVANTLVTLNDSYTVNAQGNIIVQFPLSTLVGAVVLPRTKAYVQGQVDTLPPVPPASIGRILPSTPYMIYPWALNPAPGQVYCAVRTVASSLNPPASGVIPFYGSQPVKSGTSVAVVGIAWGTP